MASSLASQSLQRKIMRHQKTFSFLIPHFLFLILLSACSPSKYISRQSSQLIFSDSNFTAAHVGISIYDPSSNKYLYEHQADKYFIPASNTKLYTCYAAMKHLGDSLVGLRYVQLENDSTIIAEATGDPTLLHPDFKQHNVFSFFSRHKKWSINLLDTSWKDQALGNGWAWNDYEDDYMAERSRFPIQGNIVTVSLLSPSQRRQYKSGDRRLSLDLDETRYKIIKASPFIFDSLINEAFYDNSTIASNFSKEKIPGTIRRKLGSNDFLYLKSNSPLPQKMEIPFSTNEVNPWELLADSTKAAFFYGQLGKISGTQNWQNFNLSGKNYIIQNLKELNWRSIHSQPTDSLLKPMMHRSDNFFAEQTLLMVSNKMTGVMNDAKIIDSLLKTDFKDLPQKPRWVDGSGLSRYNLFSPNDMVTVLNKMKNEFAWNRITTILATGGEGTLSNYYVNLKDRIFAKTGTLSNNIAISGFLITKQNKTLIFSVLVNNHMGNTTQIRRAVEKFLTAIADKY
jgi:D-alanyl-D-alanine carboxypeptidase/D-alanyl-D-alanine-endopeptidase (penicillin-binding protein 4)